MSGPFCPSYGPEVGWGVEEWEALPLVDAQDDNCGVESQDQQRVCAGDVCGGEGVADAATGDDDIRDDVEESEDSVADRYAQRECEMMLGAGVGEMFQDLDDAMEED
jgi:hypothetical protein